jgi:hypothetical protein
MSGVISNVKTLEITRATRSTRLDGLEIKEGQYISLLDGKLCAAAEKSQDVIFDLLARIDTSAVGIISIYKGSDAKDTEAEKIRAKISRKYPAVETEIIDGGQPYYDFIISVE